MINYINSTRSDGPMIGNKKFYSECMTTDEIKQNLLERRIKLGEKLGFDGTKILVPYQNVAKYKEGHYEDITDIISSVVYERPEYDLWNLDIPCDVMLMRSELQGVVLAYPVADCPVVIANTGDMVALAHCGAREIDRLMPFHIIDAIEKEAKVNEDDLEVYIGPCASSQTYIYETYPEWATRKNTMWNHCIEEKEEGFHINLRKAVLMQLRARGIKFVEMNNSDTISNPLYYSNYAANHGDKEKDGRFLTGVCFKKEKVKVKEKELVKSFTR